MAGLPMLLSRIVLLDGCIVFSSYLLVVIGLENSRNDLTCCRVSTEGCNKAKHCCPTVKLFCFWSHDEVRDVYVNKCKPIVKQRKASRVRLAPLIENYGTTATKKLSKGSIFDYISLESIQNNFLF